MNHRTLLLLIGILTSSISIGQTPIDVAETTLKIAGFGEEEFYYGFAEGDQLIFSFEEVKGKELKEVEIIELPSSSRFMDYKTSRTEKTIVVNRTGVYKFRLANSAMAGRICRVKVQRIPADASTATFNTSVYWRTQRDTSYYMENERYLISRDTLVVPVIEHKVERVHSQTAIGKTNKSTVEITLPSNTVSWAYYLGVGKNAEAIYEQAEAKAQRTRQQVSTVSGVASGLAAIDPTGSASLVSLALKGYAEFGVPENADNIQYWITDYDNASLFLSGSDPKRYDAGNGPLCTRRMTSPTKGTVYFCLLNDNVRDGIDVHIRIAAVTVSEAWGNRQVRKYKVNSYKVPYLNN